MQLKNGRMTKLKNEPRSMFEYNLKIKGCKELGKENFFTSAFQKK